MVAKRFRLLRLLGRGAMGSVWLARDLHLGARCAVKVMEAPARRSAEAAARFEQEARTQVGLQSPHVVRILDHGIWKGTPYIAMEYLQGETLWDRLRREHKLDPAATHRVVEQVARALTRAHGAGIVHRDLKPENIFLVRGSDGDLVKVLDFGVAKHAAAWRVSRATLPGLLVGTPAYMSPEQASGANEIDGRADLWSLAVVAYECLTGEAPFAAEGLWDLLMQIMFEPVPVPSAVAPELPPGFDAWWKRAMSRSPDARFQSARELADALAIALGVAAAAHAAEPAPLRPPPPRLPTQAGDRKLVAEHALAG